MSLGEPILSVIGISTLDALVANCFQNYAMVLL